MEKPKATDSAATGPQATKTPDANEQHPIEKHFTYITRYHYYIFSLLFLSKIPIFWHFVSLIFLSPDVSYECSKPQEVAQKLAEGDKKVSLRSEAKNACPCPNPVFETDVFTNTIQMKFGAICEKASLVAPCHSIMYTGALVGSFTFGFLADKYGRLRMFCVSFFCLGLFGSLCSFMPHIAPYIVMRFLEGFGIGGAIVTGYVLCVEYCGVKQRALVSALYHLPLNVGHLTMAGLSYLVRDFDKLQLTISIPLLFFTILYWICLESPKWLMDSNQMDKAAVVMGKIGKCNGVSYGNIKGEMEQYHATHVGTNVKKAVFFDIFKYRALVINFFCMAYIYFVCGMGYYGVSQYIGKMSGNIHKNVAISGALLIPATLSCIVGLHYLSRKLFLMITNIVAGCLLLVVVLVVPKSMNILRVVCACLGNCFFWMSFIIVFLFGVELFPTSVRNSVLGVLAVMSRLGQILAPFINQMSSRASGIIFGVLAIVGGILCIPLPETKNKMLPSSLEEYRSKPASSNAAADSAKQGVNIK